MNRIVRDIYNSKNISVCKSQPSKQQSENEHAQNVFERPGSRDPLSANEILSFPCFFAGAFLRDGLTAMFSKAALRDVTQP